MSSRLDWLARACGRGPTGLLGLMILLAPAYLFADHLGSYRLHLDDFAFVGGSRTLPRAVSSLFTPHMTHIVPAWRVVAWGVVGLAGRLSHLQSTMAGASYAILAGVMLLMGRIARTEMRSTLVGLVAMALTGVTSVLESSATWFSASQTLWAGFGVLMTVRYLQGWRRFGGHWRLVAAAASAWLAGGMWTIGHIAGPAGAAYLWTDGRPQARRAAIVPLLASLLAVILSLALGGGKLDATVSLHGRTPREAFSLRTGATHSTQAVVENLLLGNLGLVAETTVGQSVTLCGGLVAAWLATLRRGRPSPLEAAGGVIVVGSYLVEWSFRGYLPFDSLRLRDLAHYNAVPHLGLILFGVGVWGRLQERPLAASHLTWGGFFGVLMLTVGLVAIHQPRVDANFRRGVPAMSAEEARIYMIPSLQRLRAVALADEFAAWQNRHLARLDASEKTARQLGIGRNLIHQTFGTLHAPEISKLDDAVDLLNLPSDGPEHNSVAARAALAPFFTIEPEPRLPLPSVRP